MEMDLFAQLYSLENLQLAFEKARKRKTLKKYVIDFEEHLTENLNTLRNELISKYYYSLERLLHYRVNLKIKDLFVIHLSLSFV